MREFMILIAELLFIAIVQTIVESIFDAEERQKQLKVVNIACIAMSYVLLIRYVYNQLWGELAMLANSIF